MSKLSFRARALDPSKPMPIFLAEELPDLPEYSAINRAVPQMPSGMEKEEESEHHLQRAICAGLIIPTPEVFETECEFYERSYPNNYKMPRQMIHMQPLNLEQDIPDYDMDSADESWVNSQTKRLDLSCYKFEQMMDRLEKSSGQTVVTLNEAKALLKQDDEVSIAVYDYWLHKRLKTQHPLILTVKTENRGGIAANSPYLAFRRRTEKMQTRKNRKNDEASYEKMLKLRRDLSRAVTLLEMIKKREKTKREQLHLTIEVVEKRYQARDFSGQLLAEFQSQVAKSSTRPAFTPLYTNQYSHMTPSPQHPWTPTASGGGGTGGVGLNHYGSAGYGEGGRSGGGGLNKRDMDTMNGGSGSSRKEKRQYKKRKHKHTQREKRLYSSPGAGPESMVGSSEEEDLCNVQASESEDEGPYGFKRNKSCQYNMPVRNGIGNWPWTSKEENGSADPRYRFTLTSLAHPRPRCIGFARRRIGRGGRVIIDRMSTDMDELWSRLDYKIFDSAKEAATTTVVVDSVVTAIEEPQTQKRLLDIHLGVAAGSSLSGSSNNNISSNRSSANTIQNNGRGAGGAGEHEDVIKSEHATAAATVMATGGGAGSGGISSSNHNLTSDLSKVLDRHSNVNNTTAAAASGAGGLNQNNSRQLAASRSLDRLNSSSSGYLSQQSSLAALNSSQLSGVAASASMDAAAGLAEMAVRSQGELQRSLSLPMARAFQDVSASPATLSQRSAGTEPVVVATAADWDNASMDNEDDMSLAELARKSVGKGGAQSEDELFALIRKEWLHFKPKPRETSKARGLVVVAADVEDLLELPKISTMAPLNLELTTIDNAAKGDMNLPSSEFFNSEDNLFHPQPFALDDLEWRESPHSSAVSSLSASPVNGGGLVGGNGEKGLLLEQSLSGDSLNELSLNLGDDEAMGEDNEKVLENILQECQMGDLKILDDPTIFTGLQDTDEEDDDDQTRESGRPLKNLFEQAVGYESEFLAWAESYKANGKTSRRACALGTPVLSVAKSSKRSGAASKRRRRRVGKSRFKLSRVAKKDETFSPNKLSQLAQDVEGGADENGPMDVSGGAGGGEQPLTEFVDQSSGATIVLAPTVVGSGGQQELAVDGVAIKQEPDTAIEDGVIQMHEIKIEKQEEDSELTAGTTLMVPMTTAAHLQQQQQAQQRAGPTTRNIIFQGGTNYLAHQQGENTIILTSSLNSVKNHLNGPMSEKTLVATPNKQTVLFNRKLTAGGQTKLGDGDLIMTTGLINNGGGSAGGSTSSIATNHKFSLTPVGPNTMAKTISIGGQPATGNKFYINSASLVNAAQQQQQQITLTSTGGAQGGTKALQWGSLAPANIKFNLMTTSSAAGGGGQAGQAQDIKSILASSLPSNIIINDHAGNNIVAAASSANPSGSTVTLPTLQHQAVQGQQRTKTMNMFLDGEKRFLYTNNRGQFVAQLNPAKMVNIVPVQQQQAGGTVTASVSGVGQLQQQVLTTNASGGGNLNSSGNTTTTKIITTTKGGVQLQDGTTSRIISTSQAGTVTTRGFPKVQRVRAIPNSVQQLQNAIAKQNSQMVVTTTGGGNQQQVGGGGELRTFNRILIQSAGPGGAAAGGAAGTGTAGNGGGGVAGGGGPTTAGGSGTVSSINVNAINR